MKKIYGVFRGFPGLGRVVSGVSILDSLRKKGYCIKAFSYGQGEAILDSYSFERIIVERPVENDVMSIGLNPISKVAGSLIKKIIDDDPDLVIIDGEPLLISTLSLVFPREKIVSLLNKTDLCNPSLPLSTIRFYETHYLKAKTVIVHGVNVPSFKDVGLLYGTNIYSLNTILRPEILDLSKKTNSKHIKVILGGGCNNVTKGFFESTIKIALLSIELSKIMPDYQFDVYCNDIRVFSDLKPYSTHNTNLISQYVSPLAIYQNADLVICRAGRNTSSELLYLNIPTVLLPTSSDFRSKEQEKNIEDLTIISNGLIIGTQIDTPPSLLHEEVLKLLNDKKNHVEFKPGNTKCLDILEKLL